MKPVCLVVGVGPGNGAGLVRRFAHAGYTVAMIARSETLLDTLTRETADAHGYVCDVGDPSAVAATYAHIVAAVGSIETVVYNAGKGVWGTFEEVSLDDFELSWRVNVLGALAVARAAAPAMRQAGRGQFVFIGATASRRGGRQTAAFGAAKAAQRSLAASMARELGPAGIHVSLVVVDGIVDEPLMRKTLAQKPDEFFVHTGDIAETVLMLVRQPRSAWTFELEVRPFGEVW